MASVYPWWQNSYRQRGVSWAKEVVDRGAGEILLTSMDSDGEKKGFDLALTKAVSEAVSVPVIASGGAGNAEHFVEAFVEGKRMLRLLPLFSTIKRRL